ncbi:MAG TPA: tetratricopeptide repeat protein, partial [Blastocatellia bacterium]|nr:tetratricopeptide repeat protein [Blastocatellia bacterium]
MRHDTESVLTVCRALSAVPTRAEIGNVALYYEALCEQQAGRTERSREILFRVIDCLPPDYKPRAYLAIAGSYHHDGDLEESAHGYLETARAAVGIDPLTRFQSLRGLAIVRALAGDHDGALAELRRLLPVARYLAASYPADYCSHLNSLALELGATGRVNEARHVISTVAKSPLAIRFPNWVDSYREIHAMRSAGPKLLYAIGSVFEPSPQKEIRESAEQCLELDIPTAEAQASTQAKPHQSLGSSTVPERRSQR